jgi:hypothetical protein
MRKLVLLVCMGILAAASTRAGLIPSWESPSKKLGFFPISNEISIYGNVDDRGRDRGRTLQIVSLNSFKLLTEFTIEFTGDFNYDYTPGLSNDHYMELGIVKHVTSFFSVNVQRVMSTFEADPINQYGVRFSF